MFAKSDMIHAQQKGYTPPEILRGLCDAVARNFKSSIVKGRKVTAPGRPHRRGVAEHRRDAALREAFELQRRRADRAGAVRLVRRDRHGDAGDRGAPQADLPRHPPAEPARVGSAACRTRRRCRWRTWFCSATATTRYTAARRATSPFPAFLGIDIGSVSTNVVAMDEWGSVIQDVYLRTAGRPIEAVQQGLAEIEREWGRRLVIEGVGTTGSGRELIAELVGADVVNDEITAHKTGALHVSTSQGGEPVDTIFEIGGQDSKFISIENGVVVDFAMNEACAAGTGSFLEEQAEKLGISIKGEFAQLALSSPGAHAAGRALHGVHGARRDRLAAQGRDRCRTWWRAWRTRSRSTT